MVENIIPNQDTVTHSNTAAGDNCYVIHAHKFLIPYQKMEIFDVNSISTEQDAVPHSPKPSTSAKAATEVGL